MRKWRLFLAGMMLTLSLSAVAGCGEKTENDMQDNNRTDVNDMMTDTENRLNNDAGTTYEENYFDATEDGIGADSTGVNVDNPAGDGNVIDDVVDGVSDAGKDVIDGVENGVNDLTDNAEPMQENNNENATTTP